MTKYKVGDKIAAKSVLFSYDSSDIIHSGQIGIIVGVNVCYEGKPARNQFELRFNEVKVSAPAVQIRPATKLELALL